MGRVAYVNGRYIALARAAVSVEDRGFQFADGVYEFWSVFDGRLADAAGHLARLERSLGELRIPQPMNRAALEAVLRETVRRNRVSEGTAYLQVTRGAARRDHAFPDPPIPPTVVVTARPIDFAAAQAKAAAGVAVITLPDIRWGRCDIKTVGLLPNALARQAARESDAYEAWLVDGQGLVTEGAATNAWIVDEHGVLRTRTTNANILRGVTRNTLMELAQAEGLEVSQTAFTVAEAQAAREAFCTAASSFIAPVVRIDGAPIGEGRPGPLAMRLRDLYIRHARQTAV